jgi:hypothetical protein
MTLRLRPRLFDISAASRTLLTSGAALGILATASLIERRA